MRLIFSACFALILSAAPAISQGLFSPVIDVNGDVVSKYELNQREQMLRIFNTPGDLASLAREQLIDDRLRMQELKRAGIALTEEGLRKEMEAFADRANLPYDQFLRILQQNGVAEETLRDFVQVGSTWREYIRTRFRGQANISDADIDRALGNQVGSASGVEVLLNEIIIAAPPPQAAAAQAEAKRIAQMTTTRAFESAARRVSALPSRTRGGRLGWLPITNYPPALRSIILDLAPGQVTAPIPIQNGIALFQMRDVREVSRPAQTPAAIEYLTFAIPGGTAEEAAAIMARVDTCDDFYGIAKGLPADRLQRQSVKPSEIPSDVAAVLAGLDTNETSYGLNRNGGQTQLMVMLCGRTPELGEGVDREAIRNQLMGQRLSGYADALLADLRASATIK